LRQRQEQKQQLLAGQQQPIQQALAMPASGKRHQLQKLCLENGISYKCLQGL